MADCTNDKSEKGLINLKYKVKGRFMYKDFIFKGNRPF